LPSLGPFHIPHLRYNAATVLAILERAHPEVLYLASLSPEALGMGVRNLMDSHLQKGFGVRWGPGFSPH